MDPRTLTEPRADACTVPLADHPVTRALARTPPERLAALYAVARAGPSDIHEHLDVLRALAARCEHVTEFGLRWASGSTIAFLAAQPATCISWDVEPAAVVSSMVAELLNTRGRTRFQPRVGDTLEIEIEETDLLFVDTLHTARQLKAELVRHGMKARKYLVFHDTATFGERGEDGSEPGLRAAIRWFQRCEYFPLWRLLEDRPQNNGLVVLQRESDWEREQGLPGREGRHTGLMTRDTSRCTDPMCCRPVGPPTFCMGEPGDGCRVEGPR